MQIKYFRTAHAFDKRLTAHKFMFQVYITHLFVRIVDFLLERELMQLRMTREFNKRQGRRPSLGKKIHPVTNWRQLLESKADFFNVHQISFYFPNKLIGTCWNYIRKVERNFLLYMYKSVKRGGVFRLNTKISISTKGNALKINPNPRFSFEPLFHLCHTKISIDNELSYHSNCVPTVSLPP